MNSALFNNETDNKNMTKGIGARKLAELRIEKESYEKEIEIALAACADILQSEGARSNFIAEIYDLENEMENEIDETIKQSFVAQIKDITLELTKLLKNVPREIGENLAFFSKQIINRRGRIQVTQSEIQELLNKYTGLDEVDRLENYISLEHIFAITTSYTGEKYVIEDITPKYERKEVLGIKKASNKFLEKVGLIEVNHEAEFEKPITNTSGLFGIVNNVFSDINSHTIEEDFAVVSKETEEPVDEIVVYNPEDDLVETEITSLFEESEDLETDFEKVIEFPSQDIINEEEINAPVLQESNVINETPEVSPFTEEVVEVKEEPEKSIEDTIPFYMTGEYTLAELATAVCDDPAGWIDIYEANKKEFDEIIKTKHNGNIEGIENNKELFKDLTINVPMEFNKGQDHKQDQTLGMAS